VQYYKNVSEVERLIQEVRRVLAGARFLIADIPIATSVISQAYGLLKGAFKEKGCWKCSG
jgi:hypothetical protein